MDNKCSSGGPGGAVYGFGVLGVAVYYLQQSHTIWDGLLGIGKAIIWPALLMYKVFGYFQL